MDARRYTFGASGNPIIQGLWLLVFGAALIVAVLMGAVILAVVLGLAVVASIVIAVRVWWLRRKLAAHGFDAQAQSSAEQPGGRLIEAEYTVIDERSETGRRERDERP